MGQYKYTKLIKTFPLFNKSDYYLTSVGKIVDPIRKERDCYKKIQSWGTI